MSSSISEPSATRHKELPHISSQCTAPCILEDGHRLTFLISCSCLDTRQSGTLVCCFVRAVDLRNSLTQCETDAPSGVISHDCTANPEILVGRVGQMHLPVETSEERSGNIDERLLEYFQCADEGSSQEQLEYLLEGVAKPIIQRIVQRSSRLDVSRVGYETSPQDVAGEALVRVLKRLRASKLDHNRQVISNFQGLVATITYRAIADHLRLRNRERTNLEKKIRRLFAANNDLGVWKDDEKNVVCGYGVWRSNEPGSSDPRSVYPTQSELSLIAEELRLVTQKSNTAELILLLLNKIRRPIKLNNFVDLITGLVVAKHSRIDEITYAQLFPTAQDEQIIPTGAIKTRLLLERLFAEIQKLGIEQRKSLLLNMTDNYGYSIEWFLFTRIATEAELAGLLEISIDEFKRLLNDLPMTDKEIAKQLGMSPTRVANIRKAVRERLARCRHAFLRENEG